MVSRVKLRQDGFAAHDGRRTDFERNRADRLWRDRIDLAAQPGGRADRCNSRSHILKGADPIQVLEQIGGCLETILGSLLKHTKNRTFKEPGD